MQERGIAHIVTQNNRVQLNDAELNEKGTDVIIANSSSLYVGMRKAGINDQERVKYYIGSGISHNGDLPYQVTMDVNQDIQYFIANPPPRK